MKQLVWLLGILSLPVCCVAQDSTRFLSDQQVMEIVSRYHPVARQATLLVENAKAAVTVARGMFDPVLENEVAEKTFDGVNYYSYHRPELRIPSWFGVELKAGLEQLSGSRTDPTETRGRASFAGISMPLGKNLLMDKRRAALQTARIFRDASPVEQQQIINDLMQEALRSYWDWTRYYQEYRILQETVNINQQRFSLVKTASRLGDRPAIDTTEALAQLQSFELMRNEALLSFQNAGITLSQYLWRENNQPYDLPADVLPTVQLDKISPASLRLPSLDSLLNQARNNHPELRLYPYKLEALAIEKKLKFQELLPTVNFTYNWLGKGYDLLKTFRGPLLENNFQYGIRMGIPLRLSQGRGEYRQARIKIADTRLSQSLSLRKVENTVQKYFNELALLQQQIYLQEQAYRNYAALQRGEETRFRAGESSLFLVNARENKTLEALQKLQYLKAGFFKTGVSLQWAAGLLGGR